MTDKEKAVAKRLIEALLARGLAISVYCDGELDLEQSTDLDKIFEYATACYHIEITAPELWFLLVYGNADDGSELISDFTGSALAEEIVREVERDPT